MPAERALQALHEDFLARISRTLEEAQPAEQAGFCKGLRELPRKRLKASRQCHTVSAHRHIMCKDIGRPLQELLSNRAAFPSSP
ncbi:unnamed protein product [Strongylus vulgaris]|uniref:Uncharacterized protein n=1 Tax=Strongylus vulgaris TaxID=40348 RepID=A0A3P7JME8_STRVU|nr:unnamed protein product [Strongylus vulgaris]